MYSGLGTAVLGSAPTGNILIKFVTLDYFNISVLFLTFTAALFFFSYEYSKRLLSNNGIVTMWQPVVHMTSAAFGEIVSDYSST